MRGAGGAAAGALPGVRAKPLGARPAPARARARAAPGSRGAQKGTGVQRAYVEIRDRIVHLDLAPGDDVDEALFVRRLGISRTPVRQALVQLHAEGLVELLPNRGARVAPLDLSAVREFFEAFELAQRAATRWAAARRTEQAMVDIERERDAFEAAANSGDVGAMMEANRRFHESIGAACGNRLVARHYAQLLTQALRLSRLALVYETSGVGKSRREHVAEIVTEHRLLVARVAAGDAEGADALACEHSRLFHRRIADYLAQSLAPTLPLAR